ncbi:unnamed protein product [Eruca vesicaria subsp. sativa]|uniref:Uncharacterized protein n=1 Tax=Eruca vesicaria subsp. sativa TaxID=29727 RepID=A0ABC8LZ72_ERUVS|nr:unnamed protein product [Eruca vesicaria subsp. sativa]
MDLEEPHFPYYPAPAMVDILSVEADPDFEVTSLIPIKSQPQPGWGVWPDAFNDDLRTSTRKAKPASPKVLKPRKTRKISVTHRKQRCISNYFQAAASSRTSNNKILELLSGICEQISNIQNKQRLIHKFVEQKTKINQADKACQTESPNLPTAMDEDHTFTQSPVISQYKAQMLRKEATPEPVHTSPNQTSPIHTSPNQTSPIHTSPTQTSPIHTSLISTSPIKTSTPVHNAHFSITPPNTSPNHTFANPFNDTPIQERTPTQPTQPSQYRNGVIYDASEHPDSPEINHILYHGKLIFDPISPDPPSLIQPKYDSSINPSTQRRIFPLSPFPLTPSTSPNKSSDILQGFVGHASGINAFSATATSTHDSVVEYNVPKPQVRNLMLLCIF